MSKTRIERDSMGEMEVPEDAYYGAQTQRAVINFPISGRRLPAPFIHALGLIKRAAAETNMALGKLDRERGEAIRQAAEEVHQGRFDEQFVIDVFQTGSGTSTNMNANEVIATRANELLGCRTAPPGERKVHPNDHVNMGQSSNDVIPTASHVSAARRIQEHLLPALEHLETGLRRKSGEMADVIKIGRTHLMDATPLTLGQEIGGWATQVARGRERLQAALVRLRELALGGTAVGTGINTHPEFAARAIALISKETGQEFREAENHFEAQAARDAMVEASGALKTVAVSLMKIANDIRLMGSGPSCGIGELKLPAVQPGSSIMPGKVNPVIAEALAMVCAQVIGNDATITIGGQSGLLDLNVMIPVMALNLLDSIEFLGAAARNLQDRCIAGMEANRDRCAELVEKSLAMVTSLAPIIGYEPAAALAKEALQRGKTVREVALEKKVLPPEELERVLDPRSMLAPKAE